MKAIFHSFILLCSATLFAQNSHLTLDIKIEDDDNNNKALKEAQVKIYQDHELIAQETSDSLGAVKKIQIPAVGSYIIKVEKEGYASKFGTINTTHFDPQYLSGNIKFPMEVGLVKPTEVEDYAFLLKEPMITFYLDTSGEQAWDEGHLQKMLDKVKKCQAGWTAEEVDAYNQPKSEAQTLMDAEDFVAAKETLIEAQKIKDTPEIQALIKDCEIGQTMKDSDEMMYANFINIGDQLLDNKRYEEARAYYQKAIEIKPKEVYPQEKMAQCEAIVSSSIKD
ncbi:MAG: tetratricopeptide repeat protein [Crocinitomicaceae bacterium]